MRKKISLLALVSAIVTSFLILTQNLEAGVLFSLVTTILIALSMRTQKPTPAPASVERGTGMKLIDELNDRVNYGKQQVQSLQAKIQQLESETKGSDNEDAAVLMFLRVLQEKSRLLDFALTDIARLPDPQVGAAARVVHQGLSSILQDSFAIEPIAGESEGQTLQLPEDFDSSRYRILHQSAAQQQSQGVILHRGWEVKKMNLPRSLRRPGDPLPSVLAPVEIEAREVGV